MLPGVSSVTHTVLDTGGTVMDKTDVSHVSCRLGYGGDEHWTNNYKCE